MATSNNNSDPLGKHACSRATGDKSREITDRELLLMLTANFKSFVLQQDASNKDLSEKFILIQSLTRRLEFNEGRLSLLESSNAKLVKRNAELTQELLALKSVVISKPVTVLPSTENMTSANALTSSEITISGVPLCITESPEAIAEKVFLSLDVGKLVTDIIDIRPLVKKSNTSGSQKQKQSPASVISNKGDLSNSKTNTYLLTLKSPTIKEFIINKKRMKKELSVNEVFGLDQRGSIYINDFLPPDLYKLYRLTKSWALRMGFEDVRIRDGIIFVYRSKGDKPISIRSEADLENLS